MHQIYEVKIKQKFNKAAIGKLHNILFVLLYIIIYFATLLLL